MLFLVNRNVSPFYDHQSCISVMDQHTSNFAKWKIDSRSNHRRCSVVYSINSLSTCMTFINMVLSCLYYYQGMASIACIWLYISDKSKTAAKLLLWNVDRICLEINSIILLLITIYCMNLVWFYILWYLNSGAGFRAIWLLYLIVAYNTFLSIHLTSCSEMYL